MHPGSQAIGIKLTSPATFMAAALHTADTPPMAFPILQRIFVKDRLSLVQLDRTKTKCLVTQALDMTPADFLAFCAFGAHTVGVIRNIPQLNESSDGGLRDSDGLNSSSATAACLLATENLLNPGPTDPNTSGVCVLVCTAYIPYGLDIDGQKTMPESYLSIRTRPPRYGEVNPMDLLLKLQQQTFQINASAGPIVLAYNGLTLELLNQEGIAFQCFHKTDSLVAARPRRHMATAASVPVTMVTGLVHPLRTTDFLTALALNPINISLLTSIGSCFPLRPPFSGRKQTAQVSTFCILWKHGLCPTSIATDVLLALSADGSQDCIEVTQTLLPGMDQFAIYAHTLTNSSDMFIHEYNAHPRTITDPRETYILQALPNTVTPPTMHTHHSTLVPTPPTTDPCTTATQSPSSSLTTTASTANDNTALILASIQHQQAQFDRFAHFMSFTAQSALTTQTFVLTDLLATAQRELDTAVDTWGIDSPAIQAESDRVFSLKQKLNELEAQRELLNPQRQTPTIPPALL